ncbi:hypothetical protein [Sandarakinorhabdus sp.]|uniref:hypothetical protein n=1 Tax=Sandarakinorhabdus sp. TaxID=1916663 RepID=UPI00333FEFEF
MKMIGTLSPRTCTRSLLLAGAALLGAPSLAQDRGLGLIVQNNIYAQLVDPNPDYAGVPIEGGNGLKADTALTRYRTGRVQPLLPLSGTVNIGGAGGGGGTSGAAQPASGPR